MSNVGYMKYTARKAVDNYSMIGW